MQKEQLIAWLKERRVILALLAIGLLFLLGGIIAFVVGDWRWATGPLAPLFLLWGWIFDQRRKKANGLPEMPNTITQEGEVAKSIAEANKRAQDASVQFNKDVDLSRRAPPLNGQDLSPTIDKESLH